MPEAATTGALGSPTGAEAPAKSLPEKSTGFPINSSADVAAALARSLASLQTQTPPPAADTPAPTVSGEEPPPETATDQQQEQPESTLSEPEAGEPEGENDDEDESKSGHKPGWQKRIDKLTAQKSELEARLAALEAKLNEPKPEPEPAAEVTPVSIPGANPLSHITSPAKLAEQRQQAEEAAEWAESQLINMEADAEVVMNEVAPHAKALGLPEDRESWTPGLVKRALMQVRKQAETTARKHVPAQAAFLIERQKAEQAAAQTFEWWNNPKAPEHQAIANSMALYPWAQQVAGIKFAFGLMVEGQKAIQARRAAQQAGEPARAPALPPKTPKRPTAAPSRVPAEQAHTDALRQRLAKAPRSEDMTQLLSLQLQQSLAPQTG